MSVCVCLCIHQEELLGWHDVEDIRIAVCLHFVSPDIAYTADGWFTFKAKHFQSTHIYIYMFIYVDWSKYINIVVRYFIVCNRTAKTRTTVNGLYACIKKEILRRVICGRHDRIVGKNFPAHKYTAMTSHIRIFQHRIISAAKIRIYSREGNVGYFIWCFRIVMSKLYVTRRNVMLGRKHRSAAQRPMRWLAMKRQTDLCKAPYIEQIKRNVMHVHLHSFSNSNSDALWKRAII